ncbi:MAG TPA: inositol monophosphatase family protein [Acidimicrobiales bacterium]|nr:inositol monophosphatase family protein [Acidimicrobiales bacterium]
METPSPDDLRRIAIDVALDAAAFVAAERASTRWFGTTDTKSTPTDMVTAVDKASEARIVAALRARRPDDGIVAEEGSATTSTTGVTWVIDPIDGTTNFVYGYPAVAVSVAAVDGDDASIAGAVVDIGRREVFSAARGVGAFCDDEPMTLPGGPAALGFALIGTGFSYHPDMRVEQAAVVSRILPIVRDIRRGGSAALDLCWAAAGRTDAYYERGTAPWDRAAGLLIAHEAGLHGDFVGDLVWVAHPRIADDLYALITR